MYVCFCQAHTPRIPYNGAIPLAAPRVVHEFLERHNWGDFHMAFHMSRKYYVMGPNGRRWLDEHKEKPGPFQGKLRCWNSIERR